MNTISQKPYKSRASDGERFAQLASMGEMVFTTQNLATIWGIRNRATLRITLARYVKRGLMHRIWKGLYCIGDPRKINPWVLGIRALGTYCYVSSETVLFDAGTLNQRPYEITLVSNVSKRFTLLGQNYRSRKMKDSLLYDDTGIEIKNGIRVATPNRAKRDLSYFNPQKYYDANI